MKFTHLIKLDVSVSILSNSRARNGILHLVSLLEVVPLFCKLELNVTAPLPQMHVSCLSSWDKRCLLSARCIWFAVVCSAL